MVNAIPGRNLPVLNFAYHLPRPCTDPFANVNGLFSIQISSYSRAYVRLIYRKEGQIPLSRSFQTQVVYCKCPAGLCQSLYHVMKTSSINVIRPKKKIASLPRNLIAELSRARSARSGAPWVTKVGKLSIRENLVMT